MFDIDYLDIPPLTEAGGVVQLPGSKSISNRVLLLAALCAGETQIHDLLDSDDTRVMLDALVQLGCEVKREGSSSVIRGVGSDGFSKQAKLFLGNAGTAMRPLTAALAVTGGDYELSGVARMHERPIGDLVDALKSLGCSIDYLGQEGYPPLRIGAAHIDVSRVIPVRGDVSSQFLTALLLTLPLVATQDMVIAVQGELISKPYVAITLNLMARFGVQVQNHDWQQFVITKGARYQSPRTIHVEADASSASYFIALGGLAAAADAPLRIEGVSLESIQGDIRFIEAARAMGVSVQSDTNSLTVCRGAWPLKAIDLDCNHIPDAAMTLAVMALYADAPSTLRNIASWRVKETDRIHAMATELRKLGAQIEEGVDYLRVSPILHAAAWKSAAIATYDDHRMAMCFSLTAFNAGAKPVRILDPKCVAKTFPDYFETLFRVVQAKPEHIPVICIDGPTASGKGSLASRVATRLGFHYLDSGALYRLAAFAAGQQGVALDDEAGVAAVCQRMQLRFEGEQVFWEGDSVGEAIRTEAAGMAASKVSAYPAVRQALLELQRSTRRVPGLVADGRDMGTVVFPDAALKVFLTASATTRAQRRFAQVQAKLLTDKDKSQQSVTLDSLRLDLEARDLRDSTRQLAPLVPAQEAVLLDNSDLSIEACVNQVIAWWQSAQQTRR